VLITGLGGKTYNINGVFSGTAAAMTSVTTTQLVFTITKASSGAFPGKLTWQNVRVRPVAGAPLAGGSLRVAGTASLVNVSTNSNFGPLQEVVGAAQMLSIVTQPSPTATAGVPFAQQPVLRITDKFGNFRSNDNATVVTASRSAGSGTLQGSTTQTAASGIVSFAGLSHAVATNISILFSGSGLTNVTSSTIAVSPAIASSLAFAIQPGNATAGSLFGTQPVILTRDSFGNGSTAGLPSTLPLSLTLSSGSGPLQGTAVVDIGSAAGNGRATFTNLRIDAAGANQQLIASAGGLGTALSAVFTVNAGAASRLTMQTQPSSLAQAGVAFPQQPAVRIEDAFGNQRTSDNSTIVTVARNTGTAVLLGTMTTTAVGGIATFANLSCTNMDTIDLRFTSSALTQVISSSINIGPGPAKKLKILTQPSSTAAAGIVFVQQPRIRLEDQYGNLCINDNSTLVTAARSIGTGSLQGTTAIPASAGMATFLDLSYPIAETMNINFTSPGASNVISGNVIVSAGPYARLQVLAPGETNAPGTLTGKTGTPLAQTPDAAFNLVVNAVDANWNLAKTITNTVAISSSDAFATLPTNAPLVAGTRTFSVKLSETATNRYTATDVLDGSKTGTSSGISATARYTMAIGGSAILDSSVGGVFTSLIGPTYFEKLAAEAGQGTIILTAPAGFVFDTAAPLPTVKIETLTTSGNKPANINGVVSGTSAAMTSVSATQLVFTVNTTSSGNTCKLTWQNIRVRPTSASPLALGKLTKSGTSVMAGVTNGVSNLGTLREVPANISVQAAAPAPSQLNGLPSSDEAALASTNPTLSASSSLSVSAPLTMSGISAVDGVVQVTFSGVAGQTYQILRATELSASTAWTMVGSVTADTFGKGVFTDSTPPPGQGYYRAKQ
jgi:hypothetical protein